MYNIYENGKSFYFDKSQTLWENYVRYLKNEEKENNTSELKSICNSLYKIDDYIKSNIYNEKEIDRLTLQFLDFSNNYNKKYDKLMQKSIVDNYNSQEPLVLKLYNLNKDFCELRKSFFDRANNLTPTKKKVIDEIKEKLFNMPSDKTLMIQFLSENKNLRHQVADSDLYSYEKMMILSGILDRALENQSSIVILVEGEETYTITGITSQQYNYTPMSLDELKKLKCVIPTSNQCLIMQNLILKVFDSNKELII